MSPLYVQQDPLRPEIDVIDQASQNALLLNFKNF